MVQQCQSRKHDEIERPYSEDAANIKRLDMNSAGSLLLSKQQLRNQECAQVKKHGDTKWANIPYSKEPWIMDRVGRNLVHVMEAEHTNEGEETESIQFRPVIRVVRCHSRSNSRKTLLLDDLMPHSRDSLCQKSWSPARGANIHSIQAVEKSFTEIALIEKKGKFPTVPKTTTTDLPSRHRRGTRRLLSA